MELLHLSQDALRCIMHYLDVTDLLRLHSTFDLRIHRFLSTSGVLASLSLSTVAFDDRAQLLSLLGLLREVRLLKLAKSCWWEASELDLISGLNPVELELHYPLISLNALELIDKKAKGTASKKERHYCRIFTPNLLPNFTRLTPRLERLKLLNPVSTFTRQFYYNPLRDWTRAHPKLEPTSFFCFPPTLTAFHVRAIETLQDLDRIVEALPLGLRSLELVDLSFSVELSLILKRFSLLEELHVGTTMRLTCRFEASIPENLDRLTIEIDLPQEIEPLLRGMNFHASSVSRFKLDVGAQLATESVEVSLDFASLLPSSIEHLTIRAREESMMGYGWNLISFPTNLVYLKLRFHQEDETLVRALYLLPGLKTLSLDSVCRHGSINLTTHKDTDVVYDSDSILISARLLPRSLTNLEILRLEHDLSLQAIQDLPSGLIHLSLPSFPLSDIYILRENAPRCVVYISEPISLWSSQCGALLRSTDFGWNSKVNVLNWSLTVQNHFNALQIYFQVSSDLNASFIHASKETEDLTLPLASLPPFPICIDDPNTFLKACPSLTSITITGPRHADSRLKLNLKMLPPSITYFSLRCRHFTIEGDQIPLSMTHLTCTAEAKISGAYRRPPALTYLNAPRWSLDVLQWSLKGFKRLRCHLRCVADLDLARIFGAETIDAVTLSNMSVTISYLVTGLMVSTEGPNAAKSVTLDSIQAETREKLIAFLETPRLVPIPPSKDDNESQEAAFEPIGRVVSHIELENASLFRLCLPVSAHTVRIHDPPTNWILQSPYEPRQSEFLPIRWFSPNLVRLELDKIIIFHDWALSLPPTLRYLRLGVIEESSFCGVKRLKLPPKLEVLVWCHLVNPDYWNLPFTLAELPSKLKYLAISSKNWGLSGSEKVKDTRLSLKRLKRVLLLGPRLPDCLVLLQRLPLKKVGYTLLPVKLNELDEKCAPKLAEIASAHPQVTVLPTFQSRSAILILDEFCAQIEPELDD